MADLQQHSTMPVADTCLESVSIPLDNGKTMSFKGRQFAGNSWRDEETGISTRQALYTTSTNEQIYAITERQGLSHHRRAYRVGLKGDLCTIHNGQQEITIPLDMLLIAVHALTGLDAKTAKRTMADIEETLRAASC